ncbi:hypothetical protein TDB9533_04635 [Thalassocella blandensis]|nr:hypothetical protein TDB9533_04635 [Thalassocella blandensis]
MGENVFIYPVDIDSLIFLVLIERKQESTNRNSVNKK